MELNQFIGRMEKLILFSKEAAKSVTVELIKLNLHEIFFYSQDTRPLSIFF